MKSIPVVLQSHYDSDSTTTCLLFRLFTKSGVLVAMTSLDADVEYDPATVDPHGTGDAWGSALHLADNGASLSRMQQTADLNVDNAELEGGVSDTGITEAQIRAGFFDFAKWRVYRVNYLDLTQGHELVASGTVGETKFSAHEWRAEFRSLIGQLKQPVSTPYSLTCRAQFGDAKCGKAFVWVSGSVTAVGAEIDRVFTDTALAEADGHFVLGVVEWLTGDNAGAQMEVDTNASDVLTLSLPLAYPIQVGDTYRVRQDCDKTLGMCKDTHANLVNFRGEPFIPVSDGGASQVPGAQVS